MTDRFLLEKLGDVAVGADRYLADLLGLYL
jgi:hypothetical protein